MKEKIFYSEHFYNKVSKDLEALKKNADEFPFSSLTGFLLLYHYKRTSHPAFESTAKRVALLFNNQNWLQFQLNDASPQHEEQSIVSPEIEKELQARPLDFENEFPAPISLEQNFVKKTEGEVLSENADAGNVEKILENDESISHIQVETLQQEKIEIANGDEQIEIPENHLTSNLVVNAKADEHDSMHENTEAVAFEPLHTVDYFASQGIKISEEFLQNDKLGSQMKSFTEWLRSMKKLHPFKLEEQGLATEKLIQHASNESNVNTEILTEAMAEVLIKQEKKEKAIEMFSKLSLINPSKSAYFAARIESIKSS